MELERLCAARWDHVWTTGGKLDPQPMSPSDVFCGDLFVETSDGVFWIAAHSVPHPQFVETFAISVAIPSDFLGMTQDPQWSPPLRRVARFPDGLALAVFMGQQARRFAVIHDAEVPSAILLETGVARLLLYADHNVPEACAVTSADARIDEKLAELRGRGCLRARFAYGEAVRIVRDNSLGSVSGIARVETPEHAVSTGSVIGDLVYVIELGDGSSFEVPERELERAVE